MANNGEKRKKENGNLSQMRQDASKPTNTSFPECVFTCVIFTCNYRTPPPEPSSGSPRVEEGFEALRQVTGGRWRPVLLNYEGKYEVGGRRGRRGRESKFKIHLCFSLFFTFHVVLSFLCLLQQCHRCLLSSLRVIYCSLCP